MLFPRTIYADRNTLEQQIDHIESEIREAREALELGDFDHVARELVDVQHSADTGLRIAMEQHGADSYGGVYCGDNQQHPAGVLWGCCGI